ncbi:JmjC domain-containing protein [Nocardioides sp. URHA0020]|uniref:JmjC domain-containing protein n=1 Tax=Nocardioides sp. URHA0020 TaxID=1380392 RepID=UPI000490BF90|nr:cupin domain-containing protein [Nocardioides sp. URHA0020]
MKHTPWPAVDRSFQSALAQRQQVPFTHGLAGDPRFSLDEIARLGDELGADSVSAERASKPLVSADAGAGTTLEVVRVSDQIRALAANDSWFTLLNIEQSEPYRALVDQLLEGMAADAGIDPATMKRRMGFVFASSPGSVTAAHFDIEHSFLLQLEGRRTLGFGRFADREQREREVHRYWNGSFGRLDTLPEQVDEIELGPGRGAYIPPYTPHWLTNGDDTSLSLTITFFNRDNADESMVQAFNEKVRRVGMDPRVYGDAPGRDRAKVAFMRAYGAVKRRVTGPETSASH